MFKNGDKIKCIFLPPVGSIHRHITLGKIYVVYEQDEMCYIRCDNGTSHRYKNTINNFRRLHGVMWKKVEENSKRDFSYLFKDA